MKRRASNLVRIKKFLLYPLFQNLKSPTDFEALKYVINNRDLHGRVPREKSTFSEYNFEIVYRPGPRNANADYLFRPVRLVKLALTM